jgi:hypothetical protein
MMQKLTWWACLGVAALMGCSGDDAEDSNGADEDGSGYSSAGSAGDGLGEGTSDPNAMNDDAGSEDEPTGDGTDEPHVPEAGSTTGDSDDSATEGAGDAAAN